MRTKVVAALALCWIAVVLPPAASEPADSVVRPPAVAGKFYPSDAGKLEAVVRAFLKDAVPKRAGRAVALVAPHAGYIFSGQIAADAFRQVEGEPYDTVVILATNHTLPAFGGVSVFQGRGLATPLGVVPCDHTLAQALLTGGEVCTYRPDAHWNEHSEEVQVPFVQVVLPGAKVVSAVVGTSDPVVAARFGRALARILEGRKALIVASSDLSHYPSREDAEASDAALLRAVVSLDAASVTAVVAAQEAKRRPNLVTCACGEGPILAAMAAARALGAMRGVVLSHATSGDSVMGESDRVVGYGAVAFYAGGGGPDTSALNPPEPARRGRDLTADEKAYLLKLARGTLEGVLTTGVPPLPRTGTPGLASRRGAFVTWKKKGDLRGCIGHMAEDESLSLTVARMALEAAFNDPRFPKVGLEELKDLEVEISALTPMARVAGPGAVRVGTDGVLMEKSGRRAVFLPQVAPEQGWSREEMLRNLCLKAGLDGECWKRGAEFFTFQAEVFGERDAAGSRAGKAPGPDDRSGTP